MSSETFTSSSSIISKTLYVNLPLPTRTYLLSYNISRDDFGSIKRGFVVEAHDRKIAERTSKDVSRQIEEELYPHSSALLEDIIEV